MKPHKMTAEDMAFQSSVTHLMPKMLNIPEDIREGRTQYNILFSIMFYGGLNTGPLVAVDGIDKSDALRHILCIAGSFQPKHEHKEASCAYLFSIWFTPESVSKALAG